MRVAIVGVGGVGAVLGARLFAAGHRVGFVARGERLRVLRSRGLRVVTPGRAFEIRSPEATDAPGDLGPVDAVFLCTKLYDLADAARACAPIVRDDTVVVTTQNGIEAAGVVRSALHRGRVLPGLVYVVSSLNAEGDVVQKSPFVRLMFGAMDGRNDARSETLATVCRDAGIETTLAADMPRRLWEKLIFLASMSAVSCAFDLTVGAARTGAETRALLEAAVREAVAVARAEGVALDEDAVARTMALVDSVPADATPSMLEDLRAGRRLELEFLSGAVVRRGAARGVDAPVHRMLCARLERYAAGGDRMRSSAGLASYLAHTLAGEMPHLRGVPDGPSTAAPNRPSGAGWSQREELGHLIDSAVNNHARIVRASLEPAFEGPGYDQTGWVEAHRYRDVPWTEMVDVWHAHNRILVPLIAAIPDAKLATACTVGSGPPVTLGFLIDDYVLHVRHHLDQVLRRTPATKYPRD